MTDNRARIRAELRAANYLIGAILFATAVPGCGGYGHMNGQKVTNIVIEDLVRFHKCESNVDCSRKGLIEYAEGINALDVKIAANVTRAEVAEIVSSVIQKAPSGKIRLAFSNQSGNSNLTVEIREDNRK